MGARSWRSRVVGAARGVCARCGGEVGKRDLCAHHMAPRAKYPSLSADVRNGMALCTKCHVFIHTIGGRDELAAIEQAAVQSLGLDYIEPDITRNIARMQKTIDLSEQSISSLKKKHSDQLNELERRLRILGEENDRLCAENAYLHNALGKYKARRADDATNMIEYLVGTRERGNILTRRHAEGPV